jgi:tRNA pseudouridine65 synthase
MQTLYEDEAVVVVDKAPGLLVHNSAWAGPPERTLTDLVRALFPDAVPVHRLDRQTSGCLLFAKTKESAAAAQAALSSSPKHYLALVRGHLAAAVDVDHPLSLDRGDEAGGKGDDVGKEARSRIAPVRGSDVDRCSVVVVTLFTGRRHQARRHCKHISHPILGDATHGKGPLNRDYRARYGLSRMALHAWRIAVDSGASSVVVTAPLPPDLRGPLGLLFPGVDVEAAARLVLELAR